MTFQIILPMFIVTEHDLNLEIDRLVQSSAVQKRKIAELECKLLADKFDSVTDRSDVSTKFCQVLHFKLVKTHKNYTLFPLVSKSEIPNFPPR